MPELDGNDTQRLAVGRHTLTATVRLYVYETGPALTDQGLPDPTAALGVADVPLSAVVTVYDAAHEPPLTTVEPNQRAAMAAAVGIGPGGVTVSADGQVSVDAKLSAPPVRVAFGLTVRPPGGGAELASDDAQERQLSVSAGESTESTVTVKGRLGPVGYVDVVFRPRVGDLREGTDTTPIWGEAIVVHRVPAKRLVANPPTPTPVAEHGF